MADALGGWCPQLRSRGRSDGLKRRRPFSGGTDGSNPVPSSGESVANLTFELSSVGVHPDMELSPRPARPCGMLLDEPLSGTAELEPCAVHQQVYGVAAQSWSRHRQCLPTSADGRMVWRRELKTQQPKDRCDQPFGLA